MAQQQQIQAPQNEEEQSRWARAWYHFRHSNYVTWFTDWFLTLGGKSAHSVLIVTTLYMSAELYPGISLPPALNITVFLTQMFALDMGGMGLATLARQALADGNEQGAHKAQLLSRWLIGIMIAGIVTVCIEHAISNFHLTTDAQNWIDAIKIMIEVVLVVARAFCAVLYGVVIHALHADRAIHQQTQEGLQQQNEELAAAVADLQQHLSGYQHQATTMQIQLGSAQGEIDQLRRDLDNEQQQNTILSDELTSGQGDTAGLRKQLSAALSEIDTIRGHLSDKGRSLDQLQQRLEASQQRSATLSNELDAGQGDATSLRKQLGAALSEAEMLRSALSSKGREVASLKEMLTGNEALQEERRQQLLAAEQKQAERLRQLLEAEQGKSSSLYDELQSAKGQIAILSSEQQLASTLQAQLGAEQEGVLSFRQQLNATHLQVVDLTDKLEEARHHIEKLQNAEVRVKDLSSKLEQKESELIELSGHLQRANLQIENLQSTVSQTKDLPNKLKEKETEIARMLSDLQTAKTQIRDLKSGQKQPANKGKITSIETAKRERLSHADVLAYMDANPGMKRADVAANLGISERKVYDALAWKKDQEPAESIQ